MTSLHISSKDNPQYKHLKKIAGSARDRRKNNQTLIDGVHLINALADANCGVELIAVREGSESHAEIVSCLKRFPDTPVLILDSKLFDEISPVETPVGIIALIPIPDVDCITHTNAVLLENIQDPGNLGSILRTAAAAGIDAVFLSKGCAEAWSPKALRAGMGAQFMIRVFEQQDLLEVIDEYQMSIATSLAATHSIYDLNLSGCVAFLFGNEGAGLTPALLEKASHQVTIPMPGKVESLNVGAAVAACLFERVRQLS